MGLSLLKKLEAIRPFTEAEAWTLFKIAALSEAFGWTVLLIGIGIRHFQLPGSRIAVPIAGQIHGTIFLIYFGVLITVYSSLRWSRKKFLMAAIAGVPPYGTLLFEQWAAWSRQKKLRQDYMRSLLLVIMTREA